MIEAALDLLGDAGYGGTSIDAISRRSGVARTTIYRHWRSLAEIVHEAAMTTVGVKAVPDTGDARADLRAHLGELAAKLNSGAWGRMLPVLVDAAFRDEEILELQRRSTAERKAAAMAIAARGVELGQIRDDVDLVLCGEMLVGPIFTRHHPPADHRGLPRRPDRGHVPHDRHLSPAAPRRVAVGSRVPRQYQPWRSSGTTTAH